MLGQPELRERLSRPELRQLSQRITARYHLDPLSRKEIPAYVDHRLSVAGLARGGLFPPRVIRTLYRLTEGVPRLINVVCDRALMGAHVQMKETVDKKTLVAAAREVLGGRGPGPRRLLYGALSVLALAVLCAAFTAASYGLTPLPFRAAPLARAESRPKGRAMAGKEAVHPDQSGLSAKDRAYRTLFGAWRLTYEPGAGDVCAQALGQGLACLEGKVSLDRLGVLNKPAVLRLPGGAGTDRYAALTSLGPESATIADEEGTRVVDVKEFARRWPGEFLVLWRMPSGYAAELKKGDHGPFVAWVGKQLALAQGRPAAPGRDGVYDGGMARAVKEFQAASGLIPDGKVGPETLIALTDRPGNGEPTLHPARRRP